MSMRIRNPLSIASNRQAGAAVQGSIPRRAIVARSEGDNPSLWEPRGSRRSKPTISWLYAEHAESGVTLLLRGGRPRPATSRIPPGSAGEQDLGGSGIAGWAGISARCGDYAYRIDGPRAAGPGLWHAYDPEKVLLDPLAREVFFPPGFDREAARRQGSNLGKCRARAPRRDRGRSPRPGSRLDAATSAGHRDHLRDARPRLHAESQQRRPARAQGHLRRCDRQGSLPEGAWDHHGRAAPRAAVRPAGEQLLGLHDPELLRPAPRLCRGRSGTPARNCARWSEALHAADIQLILDVVYNHTAEGGPDGPTYSYRGIDNVAFYAMSDDPRAMYRDYTGCGNTLACASICTWTLILESLRHWVTEMHVDGFRFDLASVLARSPDGHARDGRHLAPGRHPHRSDPPPRPPDRRALGCRLVPISSGARLPRHAGGASGTPGSATTSAGSSAAIPASSRPSC